MDLQDRHFHRLSEEQYRDLRARLEADWVFEKLKSLFKSESPKAKRVEDPRLGVLVWSEDDADWETSAEHGGAGFVFHIGGVSAPHEALLSHASDIQENKDDFARVVRQFLDNEARTEHHASFRQEISTLAVESVVLGWPDRPNDGMIYFNGGEDDRMWRCDYVNREPRDLGFDS